MPTNDTANHRHRDKLPDRDPLYPPQDYYADKERDAQERRRLAEEAERMNSPGHRLYEWDGQTLIPPGSYGVFEGKWYACTPNGLLANLGNHSVSENPDGTISVTPSILVRGHDKEWHGYLTDGEWREC